jgi:hypothetical protein
MAWIARLIFCRSRTLDRNSASTVSFIASQPYHAGGTVSRNPDFNLISTLGLLSEGGDGRWVHA